MNNKILIVEDERAIREMLSLYLSKQYQVIEAEDYQSAINKLGEKPELILLDWMMPGRSGIHLIKYLKNSLKPKKFQSLC
ncbi:Phosphate regulon transcriptional regulatory protein phoB [Mannheimia haemolytica]|uniref:Phosphate regulon transcriptional regulatory protein phoB n=1 Tax=Mannheimia haemolytica TaxID=75985 RepID=A0A378N7Q9_MANHA|nr:Phosphate regulon transcriptional regulatory protein phoB [Mannheimia haemolytica]